MKTLWGSAPSFATWSAMSFPLGMWFCLCRDNPALTATKAKTTQLFLCYLLCPVPLWKHGPAEASREQPQSPAWDPVMGWSRSACSVLGVQRGWGSPPAALRTVFAKHTTVLCISDHFATASCGCSTQKLKTDQIQDFSSLYHIWQQPDLGISPDDI